MKRILIAGMGNVLRGDDGFGIRVIEQLARIQLPDGVELYEAGGAGIALAQKLMDGYDACILVDATAQKGEPGTLYRFEPEVARNPGAMGMHDLDPSKVLVLAQALNAVPEEVVVIGCVPAQTDELCQELSSAVSAAVGRAVQMIVGEVERLHA